MTMMDTMDTYNKYLEVLREELIPAQGCTEPIAIAFAGALVVDLPHHRKAAVEGAHALLHLAGLGQGFVVGVFREDQDVVPRLHRHRGLPEGFDQSVGIIPVNGDTV